MTEMDSRKRTFAAIVHLYVRFTAVMFVVAACLAVQLPFA
jgi:hypothetical protein